MKQESVPSEPPPERDRPLRRIEIWATILLSLGVCGLIAWLHVHHQNLLIHGARRLTTLRQARIELAKGFLALSLADGERSPFGRDEGLALLAQALASIERAAAELGAGGEDTATRFHGSLETFQERLDAWKAVGAVRAVEETALRIAYHDLELQADELDAGTRRELRALLSGIDREFALAFGASILLLAGLGGLVALAGRARARAEKARRLLARRHEITLRSIGDGVIVTDARGRVELMNQQAEELTGWNDAEARGRDLPEVFNIVNETSREAVDNPAFRVLAEGALVGLANHTLLIAKNGPERPIADSAAPIRDDGGEVVGVVLVFRDQSEERRFQEALKDSEVHFRTLANGGRALIWTSGLDKRRAYFNEPWLRFTGRSLMRELGDGWTEGVHPDDLDRCLSVHARAFDRREPFSMEYRLRSAGGEYRWIVDDGAPRYDAAGHFLGYIGFCLDITARKAAEATLRDSEERFRTLAESAPVGIFIQMAGRFAYLNPAAAAMLGAREAGELIGVPVVERIHPDFRAGVLERIKGLNVERRAMPPAEQHFLLPDGGILVAETAAVPFRLGDQHGALVFFQDIGERKRAAAAMRQAKEAAETASLSKSEFLANMSHEIRTPLNGVLGMLQLLGVTNLDGDQKEFLRMAIQSAKRLTQLLSDILDLSRIESGKLTIREGPFDVASLGRAVLDVFSLAAREKGLELAVDIDPRLPPRLVGDEARIRQILFNLVGNAIKFTEKGRVGVAATLLTRSGDEASHVLFSVADTGVGISDALLKTIFEPFVQAEGAYTRRFQGAGLGLSIVKKLVRALGGELAIDNGESGTEIHLSLPLASPPGQAAPAARPERETPRHADRRPRILFAEDDPVNRQAASGLLEKAGYEVVEAGDGREALRLFQEQDIDLVLMDVQMPLMDGVEATRAIRAAAAQGRGADVPVIAMTAYAMAGDRETFLAAGMDDYIAKPVDMETLRRVIDRALSGRVAKAPAAPPA